LPLVLLFPLFLHQTDPFLIYTIHRIFIRCHSYGRVHSFFIAFFSFFFFVCLNSLSLLYIFYILSLCIYRLEISLFPSQ
jgi:hypothetical protein